MPRQPYDTPLPDGGAEPFRVALPESLLADLHERLERTRWPDEVPGSGWSYGMSLSSFAITRAHERGGQARPGRGQRPLDDVSVLRNATR